MSTSTDKYKCKDCGKIFHDVTGKTCPSCKSLNTEMVIED